VRRIPVNLRPTRRKAISELITYLGNQDDRLAYDRFRARGLDIGSGRVEAACKHVVGTRMKRSGMRWSRRGSQTTLSLRVAWLNERWDELWAKRPLAA
jgi:Arc/MetJ family transcription regulator